MPLTEVEQFFMFLNEIVKMTKERFMFPFELFKSIVRWINILNIEDGNRSNTKGTIQQVKVYVQIRLSDDSCTFFRWFLNKPKRKNKIKISVFVLSPRTENWSNESKQKTHLSRHSIEFTFFSVTHLFADTYPFEHIAF